MKKIKQVFHNFLIIPDNDFFLESNVLTMRYVFWPTSDLSNMFLCQISAYLAGVAGHLFLLTAEDETQETIKMQKKSSKNPYCTLTGNLIQPRFQKKKF